MPEDRKPHPDEQPMYRNAGTNAALGIAAYVAVKPHVDKVVATVTDKLKPKKD